MNLLYFAPSMRRDYIDSLLDRTYEQFGHTRRDFEATMRQRNALLKKIREGTARREDLRFWDQKYAEYADTYGMYRDKYRHFVTNSLSLFPHFFGTYPLIYHYESSWIDQENRGEYIRTYLEKNQDRDIITGHTHIGPHRDDWGFRIQYDSMDESIQAETYLSR
jgi:DNA replication and repair protein RecF